MQAAVGGMWAMCGLRGRPAGPRCMLAARVCVRRNELHARCQALLDTLHAPLATTQDHKHIAWWIGARSSHLTQIAPRTGTTHHTHVLTPRGDERLFSTFFEAMRPSALPLLRLA